MNTLTIESVHDVAKRVPSFDHCMSVMSPKKEKCEKFDKGEREHEEIVPPWAFSIFKVISCFEVFHKWIDRPARTATRVSSGLTESMP